MFDRPIATVTVVAIDREEDDGHRLVDEHGHVWLEVGTEQISDWYPGFLFRYTPRKEQGD